MVLFLPLILRCDLCADKFIDMPFNLGVSQWVALMAQSNALWGLESLDAKKITCVGGGFDLCSADGCILAGPMFWAAMAAVASVYRAK